MPKLNSSGADFAKEERLAALKIELENRMSSIRDEIDVEKIDAIIKEMEAIEPTVLSSTTEERWENFKESRFENTILERANFSEICEEKPMVSDYSGQRRSAKRIPKVSFATVIAIIILTLSSTVILASKGVLSPIIEWAGQTLNKNYEAGMILNNEHASDFVAKESAYIEIEEAESTLILKPQHLPNGYEMGEIEKMETPHQVIYKIQYINNDNIIRYSLKFRKDGQAASNTKIETVPDYQNEVNFNGINFYIYENIDWYGATWNHLNVDYNVFGFESEDEVFKFVEQLEL